MERINCLIVDDEELARELLTNYIGRMHRLHLVGSYNNPLKALDLLQQESVDLIFLDIQMPELKGTEFAHHVDASQTRIIFTTAYSEYALEGFELNALDYLVKPITFDRFKQAIGKWEAWQIPAKEQEEFLTLKSGYDLHKVAIHNISHIASDGDYVVYYHTQGSVMCHQRLSQLEQELPAQFIRVHRSYIVNKRLVKRLSGRSLKVGDYDIPISDSYYEKVKGQLF